MRDSQPPESEISNKNENEKKMDVENENEVLMDRHADPYGQEMLDFFLRGTRERVGNKPKKQKKMKAQIQFMDSGFLTKKRKKIEKTDFQKMYDEILDDKNKPDNASTRIDLSTINKVLRSHKRMTAENVKYFADISVLRGYCRNIMQKDIYKNPIKISLFMESDNEKIVTDDYYYWAFRLHCILKAEKDIKDVLDLESVHVVSSGNTYDSSIKEVKYISMKSVDLNEDISSPCFGICQDDKDFNDIGELVYQFQLNGRNINVYYNSLVTLNNDNSQEIDVNNFFWKTGKKECTFPKGLLFTFVDEQFTEKNDILKMLKSGKYIKNEKNHWELGYKAIK